MNNGFNIKAAVAVCGAVISSLLGGWDLALYVLVSFVIIDYITGIIAAYHEKTLDSRVGFHGITKKILLFIPIVMAVMVDELMGSTVLRSVAIWFYTANEGLSILENLGRVGVLVPPSLLKTLQQLKEKGDE